MKLSTTEEQVMEMIWEYGPIFLKEIMDLYPEPKPSPSTVMTLLKRMQDKGFVGYELFGNSRQYHALVEKDKYFSKHLNNLVEGFFGNSRLQFASFFTQSSGLTDSELKDLKELIDQEIKKREDGDLHS